MSLLFYNTSEKVISLSKKVFNRHFEIDPQLKLDYDDRRKSLMYEDILYNMSYLNIAIEFDDDKIFTEYSIWLYHLMCNLMKDLSKDRIKDQMITHYELLKVALAEILPEDEFDIAIKHLSSAIMATEAEAKDFKQSVRFDNGNFVDLRKIYLERLMKNDTMGAISVIKNASDSGIPLDSIYLEILQEVMYEVGNLWQKNIITIDKEHYCTSTTQVALSQFYPTIFSRPRNGKKIITCCVGSELHEMGIRMLSDLFEYNGWNSIYLGAAVPNAALLHSIEENKPDLIALSVTMPQHLILCYDLVKSIRENYPSIKIAVGGRAFQTSDELWKKWDVDISANDAADFVIWANENIVKKQF